MIDDHPPGEQVRNVQVTRDPKRLGSKQMVATFRFGQQAVDHTVEFAASTRWFRSTAVVRLDGRQIFRRSGRASMLVGRQTVSFAVDRQQVGEIRFVGLLVGYSVSVRVAGTGII